MKKIVTLVLILVATTCGLYVSAQAVTLPYQVNFEANETSEISRWTLNPGSNASSCKDQWIINSAVHSAGRQALYISNNGIDAQFDSKSNTLYLNEFYLIDLLDLIDDDRNNTNKAFKNLSRTFVHEMIHAIRTININKKRNISRYDAMLDSILEKYDVSSLRPYIPVYSKQSKDGTFIVAYDREKKEYEEE